MFGEFFLSQKKVGDLPIRLEWLHNGTKEWIRTILMANLRTERLKKLPLIPLEMWGLIISFILKKTFNNHGLDPIKTITGWNKVLPNPLEVILAGSSILRHHHWKGWDANDWDLYTVVSPNLEGRVLADALGCTAMADKLDQQKKSPKELPPGCSVSLTGGTPTIRICWDGFNINLIEHTKEVFTGYDLMEAGYNYDFIEVDDGECVGWLTPDDAPIRRFVKPTQWTFNLLTPQMIKRAIIQIAWTLALKRDEIRDGTTFEEFSTKKEKLFENNSNFKTRDFIVLHSYQTAALDRLCVYTKRANSAGIPLVINPIEDLDKAVKLVKHFTTYGL